MLTETDKKLIEKYYTRLSLAVPAIITALLATGPFIVCELVRTQCFGADRVGAIDLACYVVVVLALLAFGLFGIISVNSGLGSQAWQELIRKNNFRGESYMSKRMYGKKMGTAARLRDVAAFYDMPLPIIGAKQAVLVIVPLLVMGVACVPSIALSYQHSNELIAARVNVADKYSKAFDGYNEGYIAVDSRTSSYYSVNYRDPYNRDMYISLDLDETGVLKGITVHYPLDLKKNPQENYKNVSAFVDDVAKRSFAAGNPLGEFENFDIDQNIAKAAHEYVSKGKNEDYYNGEYFTKNIYTSFSVYTDSTDPYFYIRCRMRNFY